MRQRSLAESLSELVDASQPARELLGVCGISGTDPHLEPVEAFLLTLDEPLSIVAGTRTESTKEASVGVGRSVKLQPACNGGVGAPTLAQRERLGVHIAARRSLPPRRPVSLVRPRTPLRRSRADVPRHGSFWLGQEIRSGRPAAGSRREPSELCLDPIPAFCKVLR